MVKSTITAGAVIERVLKKNDMMNIGAYGIHTKELLDWLHESLLEIAKKHFETDKEHYYETHPLLTKTNGKFASSGASYSAVTKRLTVTMTPAADADDVGSVVTFFDGSQTPNSFIAGIIGGFIAGSPTKYDVVTFFPIPDIANVVNVTVGEWTITGNVIPLLGENQVFAPENMSLYDISNRQTIEMLDYNEYNFRNTLSQYRDSDARWARYTKGGIHIGAGVNAPTLGTLTLSAYFLPPKAGEFNSLLSIDDSRVGELEERFSQRMWSVKTNQPLPQLDITPVELSAEQLKDRQTKEDQDKVR